MGYRSKRTGLSNLPEKSRGRPRIAIVYPRLGEGGGSESKALWTAEALKSDYRVTLITMGEVDLGRLNEYYGTSLRSDEIEIVEIPIPHPLRERFDALRSYRLARFCKRRASGFDVMMSCYNMMDFGRRGIQLIADVSFDDRLRRAFHPKSDGLKKFFYEKSPFRWAYLKFAQILSGQTDDGWRKNLTVANSRWSSELMKSVFGAETRIIYPPVIGGFPRVSEDEKENGFICIGRLVPEKRVDRMIEILEGVRGRGWKIHLHIVGKVEPSGYVEGLRQRCETKKDWIFWEGTVMGQEKMELMARHKFGISGCEREAFGIAVAEMVKAGSIVWVPNGGGQVEIVKHPTLIYRDMEDGVNKIEGVLRSQKIQEDLRNHLGKQSEGFSTEGFMSEIKTMVEEFLEENGKKEG